jgi:hypothetical protein
MKGEVVVCAREECNDSFTRKTHNQKYCSSACCRKATNDKIMVRYYENKRRKSGAKRECKCGATLSKYNMGEECSSCVARRDSERTTAVLEQISVIVWE